MDIKTIFLDNPEREYHVRELSRKLNKAPTTISKLLKEIEKEKIIVSRKDRGYLLYKGNAEHSSFRDLKLYSNIKKIRNSGLIAYLNKFYNYPSAIILFGSFRKAENTPQSDIDLCVITSKKEEPSLRKYEQKLRHKIHLFNYSSKEINLLKSKNPELLNNLINGLVIEGYLGVF